MACWTMSALPRRVNYTLCGRRMDTRTTNITPTFHPSGPRRISVKYAVIFMACNDSDAIIKSVMENKKYHAECRACFGDSKTMKLEPAWFRMGIREPPKGFSDAVTVGNVD